MQEFHVNSFCKLPSCVFFDSRLTARDKIVYAAIVETIKNKDGVCYASADYLSDKANIGRTAYFEAIENLQALGYIDRQERLGKTDLIHTSALPVYDFKDVADIPFGEYMTVDKLYTIIVENRKGDYLMFDNRTGRIRFTDGSEPVSGYDIEKLNTIKKRFITHYPTLHTGLDYPQQIKQAVHSKFITVADDEMIDRFFTGIREQESFLFGNEKKYTLKWCIVHYKRFLF